METKIHSLQQERDFVRQKQAKLRSELDGLNTREEFLMKERNLTRIHEVRVKHEFDEIVEGAKLHKTIESVDLSQSDSIRMLRDLRALLVEKTDIDEAKAEETAYVKQLET